MSNKRILKKSLNELVFDVVDECYYIQTLDASKEKATEKLIDEAATFQDSILSRMKKARGKAEFRAIVLDLEKQADHFVTSLNALNA
jgi:hypothetical protein